MVWKFTLGSMPPLTWMEAIPPFTIIVLAIGAMGGLQGLVHKGFYGKPKAVVTDSWDRHLATRDFDLAHDKR